jgi:hypothetical protein
LAKPAILPLVYAFAPAPPSNDMTDGRHQRAPTRVHWTVSDEVSRRGKIFKMHNTQRRWCDVISLRS